MTWKIIKKPLGKIFVHHLFRGSLPKKKRNQWKVIENTSRASLIRNQSRQYVLIYSNYATVRRAARATAVVGRYQDNEIQAQKLG